MNIEQHLHETVALAEHITMTGQFTDEQYTAINVWLIGFVEDQLEGMSLRQLESAMIGFMIELLKEGNHSSDELGYIMKEVVRLEAQSEQVTSMEVKDNE